MKNKIKYIVITIVTIAAIVSIGLFVFNIVNDKNKIDSLLRYPINKGQIRTAKTAIILNNIGIILNENDIPIHVKEKAIASIIAIAIMPLIKRGDLNLRIMSLTSIFPFEIKFWFKLAIISLFETLSIFEPHSVQNNDESSISAPHSEQ